MKYTTIFFDLDDTLLDTIGNTKETLEDIYEAHAVDNYYATFDDFYGVFHELTVDLWNKYNRGQLTKDELINRRFDGLFTSFGLDNSKIVSAIKEDFFLRVVQKNTLIEGATELLDYLQPNYKMHILSNGFTELQYTKMDNAGLSAYFDKVILSDVVGVNKPHPDIFTFAMQQTGTKPDEIIMIGDNIFADIQGAQESNIDQIWYNPDNESTDLKPTYIINNLSQIADIL